MNINITPPISACLVCKDGLFKEGIKSLLISKGFGVMEDYEDLNYISLGRGKISPPHLVVYFDEKGRGLAKAIFRLKNVYSQSRIVLISGDITPSLSRQVYAAGANAIVSKNTSCEDFIRLAEIGFTEAKTSSGNMSTPPAANANNIHHIENSNLYNLSSRELKIVQNLANGESNKVIANHLGITEATVKVHVRTILRKLGTTNRTKAALLAIAHGLAPAFKPAQRLAG